MIAAKSTYLWIAFVLALYLFFSLTYLQRPGLQFDEVNFVDVTMGNANSQFFLTIEPFGKKLPVMTMRYIGALKSALYVPVFRIFGASAATTRLPVVFIGLITLLVSYALFRRMFDRRIALLGLFLFATDPTFIFANKLDWGPVSLMLVLEVSSLYFVWRWMSEKRRYFLGLAGFLFGLGLYNKIIFAWHIAAVFIALFLFFRDDLKLLLHRRLFVCFLSAFLLGCLPLIAFNISIPWGTFRDQHYLTPDWGEALAYRYALFRGTLDGNGVYSLLNGEEVAFPSEMLKKPDAGRIVRLIEAGTRLPWIRATLLPVTLAGSLALILILACFTRLRKKREILFLAAQPAVIAIFICLMPDATGAHHVIMLYPFVFAVVAFAACELGSCLARSEIAAKALTALCILPLALSQLTIDARYLESFRQRGGVGYWSDAIYELSSFTRERPGKNFILMQWGMGNQLFLLSAGSIRKEELSCGRETLETCLEPLLTRPDSFFLFYAPPFADQSILETFKQVLARHHLKGRIVKTFYQRDGRPVYLVYEIVGNGDAHII
jgi:4-amino-4-deoxy-L-arabinose transferase-like glycosyltransferase